MSNIMKLLRGRHGSIKYRFWSVPLQYLKYGFHRAFGGTWIGYYSKHIDSHHSEKLENSTEYLDTGADFLEFLQSEGLSPHHRLLDYGCGILRGGLHFIPFLNSGNYVGVDISAQRLEQGQALIDSAGIDRGRYHTSLVKDCELKELGDRKFDYVWAHAVLMHMPENDIRTLLESLKRHLEDDGCFYFTFFPSEKLGADKTVRDQFRDFYYPTDHLNKIFDDAGYTFDIFEGNYQKKLGCSCKI